MDLRDDVMHNMLATHHEFKKEDGIFRIFLWGFPRKNIKNRSGLSD